MAQVEEEELDPDSEGVFPRNITEEMAPVGLDVTPQRNNMSALEKEIPFRFHTGAAVSAVESKW
ncbi:hypothetical protein F442_03633 [Phytophthora nicotianae P10297]|uniref:Uncharacterized protein n=2 Tax=Phytophthora nicotianae TaxID=4792 RepID=W2ZVW4_PHYNI|nr:hypothetical protein L914_03522 [Phytophthora nicotianae]ETP51165.1 hypothetical protein F442_03633 [Phytophthora nicotianae P10297]